MSAPARRIMLHTKDRDCSKPGCDAPAYHSHAHHLSGRSNTDRTDINDLTLACGPHNRLAENGWTTRTNSQGRSQWLPPTHLDHGQPRTNAFHDPERLLHHHDGDDAEPD